MLTATVRAAAGWVSDYWALLGRLVLYAVALVAVLACLSAATAAPVPAHLMPPQTYEPYPVGFTFRYGEPLRAVVVGKIEYRPGRTVYHVYPANNLHHWDGVKLVPVLWEFDAHNIAAWTWVRPFPVARSYP